MHCRRPYHDERGRCQEGGGVVVANHIHEGDEAEGRVVERRRDQGRESSEGQSESEDCSLAGSPYRDLSGAAVAAGGALIKGSATRGDSRGIGSVAEHGVLVKGDVWRAEREQEERGLEERWREKRWREHRRALDEDDATSCVSIVVKKHGREGRLF